MPATGRQPQALTVVVGSGRVKVLLQHRAHALRVAPAGGAEELVGALLVRHSEVLLHHMPDAHQAAHHLQWQREAGW
jgi:hypothetical protein